MSATAAGASFVIELTRRRVPRQRSAVEVAQTVGQLFALLNPAVPEPRAVVVRREVRIVADQLPRAVLTRSSALLGILGQRIVAVAEQCTQHGYRVGVDGQDRKSDV